MLEDKVLIFISNLKRCTTQQDMSGTLEFSGGMILMLETKNSLFRLRPTINVGA